jgi:hypothetical protein
MKKDQVVVGGVYAMKVSGNVVPVRITADRGIVTGYRHYLGRMQPCDKHGGWVGRNEKTGREVRIPTAAKLRFECENVGGKWKRKIVKVEVQTAG